MQSALFNSLTLIDVSGFLIIGAILVLLLLGVGLTFFLVKQYAGLEQQLRTQLGTTGTLEHAVLTRIVRDTEEARGRQRGEVNTQAIIEHAFQSELKSLLTAERFVKAMTGLMIILGLVGTFYGLTLSIGKLVSLVSGDMTGVSEMTESLTRGLTDSLAGMSVAFSTSLVGILAAIAMTLLGVFFNVSDRRTAVMVQIENYLDNVLPRELTHGMSRGDSSTFAGGAAGGLSQELLADFGQSISKLQNAVAHFDSALQTFSSTTRDFQEFNLHLKDNIQRMSLAFGDMSDTLKTQVSALKSRD